MPERNWLRTMQGFAESWSAEEVLDWALHRFGSRLALASAFGPEGMVLIDLATRLRPDVHVFTLDTGLFFPETYELIEEVAKRCTEVESGARNVDNILTNSLLPDISRQILGRMAEGEKLNSIHVGIGADGAFTYA